MKKLIKKVLFFPVHHPKKWALLRGFLVAVPTFILGFVKHDFGENDPEYHKMAVSFFKTSPLCMIGLLGATIPISLTLDLGEHFAKYLKDKESDHSPGLVLSRTLAALTQIVGRKLDRLGSTIKKIVSGEANSAGEKLIYEVTDPGIQIQEITRQIWTLLTGNCGTQRFKIVLVNTYDSSGYALAGYEPQVDQPPRELLTSKETFVAHVAKTRSFQCIPDIEKHLKKIKDSSASKLKKTTPVSFLEIDGAVNSGSICGFPILDNELNSVVYVLTIWHPDTGNLTNDFEKQHQQILIHFFHRLILEHRIQYIRNYGNKSANRNSAETTKGALGAW